MRNLIYHFYPEKSKFDFHLNYLLSNKDKFDGEKVICLSLENNENVYGYNEIKHHFNDFKLLSVENHFRQRESVSFFNVLLPYILDIKGVTFFGHSKSNSVKRLKPEYSKPHTTWTKLLYEKNLENVGDVEQKLLNGNYTTYGSFLRQGVLEPIPSCKWHYSGTFFWFNNEKLKKSSDKINSYLYKTDRWGVEGFLGSILPIEESYCHFNIDGDLGLPIQENKTHPLKNYF
jgi:hypothetical protein